MRIFWGGPARRKKGWQTLAYDVSPEVVQFLHDFARDEQIAEAEVMRRAIVVLKFCREQAAEGRYHFGASTDGLTLDVILSGTVEYRRERIVSSAAEQRP